MCNNRRRDQTRSREVSGVHWPRWLRSSCLVGSPADAGATRHVASTRPGRGRPVFEVRCPRPVLCHVHSHPPTHRMTAVVCPQLSTEKIVCHDLLKALREKDGSSALVNEKKRCQGRPPRIHAPCLGIITTACRRWLARRCPRARASTYFLSPDAPLVPPSQPLPWPPPRHGAPAPPHSASRRSPHPSI